MPEIAPNSPAPLSPAEKLWQTITELDGVVHEARSNVPHDSMEIIGLIAPGINGHVVEQEFGYLIMGEEETYVPYIESVVHTPKGDNSEVFVLQSDKLVVQAINHIGRPYGEDQIAVMARRAQLMLDRIKSPGTVWWLQTEFGKW